MATSSTARASRARRPCAPCAWVFAFARQRHNLEPLAAGGSFGASSDAPHERPGTARVAHGTRAKRTPSRGWPRAMQANTDGSRGGIVLLVVITVALAR